MYDHKSGRMLGQPLGCIPPGGDIVHVLGYLCPEPTQHERLVRLAEMSSIPGKVLKNRASIHSNVAGHGRGKLCPPDPGHRLKDHTGGVARARLGGSEEVPQLGIDVAQVEVPD
jgi:hypothetical protein